MFLTAVGINHKKSPIDIREKFYLNDHEKSLLYAELKMKPCVSEALIISTCNRTEIYCLATHKSAQCMIKKLASIKQYPIQEHEFDYFYSYFDEDAIRHLLTVSAGLDSLVVGEKEILGQLKGAVHMARSKKMFGRFFNLLSNVAIRTGKLARSQTQISRGGSSVSWAAVEKARKHYTSLENLSVLLIGAGKMSHLAANDFVRKGVQNLYVMNRTKEKGEALARKFHGVSKSFWEIEKVLSEVDVCICSSSAPHYLIELELIQKIMASRTTQLLLIDISMPRNIHPKVNTIDNVTLVSLDELDKVVEYNVQQRLDAVSEVEEIIEQKIEEFYRKYNTAEKTNFKPRTEILKNISCHLGGTYALSN